MRTAEMPVAGKRPIRVCHLIAPAPHGGAESVIRALAAGHRARGHDVRVAALLDAGQRGTHAFLDSLHDAGVPVSELRYPPRAYLRERRGVAALWREQRPDLAHFHGAQAVVLHCGSAHRLGIPSLVTVHGFTGGNLRERLYDRLHRRALRRVDAVVAVSRPLEQMLARDLAADRLSCIPNAWSPRSSPLEVAAARSALGMSPAGFQIGWIGRLEREKGADVLLEALAHLRDLSWQATLIGEGRERVALQRQAGELGLTDRVRFAGSVPDADRFYCAFDVVALSSRTEGTPIVLFEAMAAGIPIVATAVGGVPDVVGDNAALLVPAEDPTALSQALRAVSLDRPAAVGRAERASRALRDRFSAETWLQAYEALYLRLGGR